MVVYDVSYGINKAIRDWAAREGLTYAYRVEVDEATLIATVFEHARNADGKPYLDESTGDSAKRAPYTKQLSSLPVSS